MSTAMDLPGEAEPPEAFPDPATWFDAAVPRLYGYFIVRVGGRVHVAEELTQETIVAAVSASSPPSGTTPIIAWLFGIARHKLIDHYRREVRERREFGQQVDPAIIEIGPSPPLGDLDLDSIHTRDDIVATLARLNPRQRAAIVLRYFDDRDVASTAAALGLSVHATESLLARSRNAFRRIYREITGEQP